MGWSFSPVPSLHKFIIFAAFILLTLKSSSSFDLSDAPTDIVEEPRVNNSVDSHVGNVVVQSGKKELRNLRRKRTLEKEIALYVQELPLETISKDPQQPKLASSRRTLRLRNKRQKIAKNEAEMASGVKLVAELEKLRMILEAETGKYLAGVAGLKLLELKRKNCSSSCIMVGIAEANS